ncbi:MAG: cadherin repeat domain-containing protein, partial [Methanosarcinales archaeon]
MFSYNMSLNMVSVGSTPLRNISCSTVFRIAVRFARASAPALFETCTVQATALKMNVPPTMAPGTCDPRAVDERSPVGTLVGAPLVAVDENAGQPIIWTIDSTERFPFALGVCDGRITVTDATLNFTAQSRYELPIRVTDVGIPPSMSTNCTIVITINDVSDAPVLDTHDLAVYENSAVGTLVGSVVAFDTDTNSSDLVFSWNRTDSPDAFAISAHGAVTTRLPVLDFENKNVFYYRVQVTDGSTTTVGELIIRVLDDNDAPSVTSPTVRYVKENSVSGAVVPGGALTATDQDGDNMTFMLQPASEFMVGSDSLVYVAPGAQLDYENTSVYTLTLVVTDSRGAVAHVPFVVMLTNVNEAPVFAANVSSRSIPEGVNRGVAIGTPITASDPDAHSMLSFTIASVLPSTGSGSFTIDFETGPTSYLITVVATDNGVPSLNASVQVNVTVTDVNEPPVWNAASYAFSVAENTPLGTLVGGVSAVDPEGSPVSLRLTTPSFLYNLTSDGSVFTLRSPNFETDTVEELLITAVDADGMSSIVSVRVSIIDVNEPPFFPVEASTRLAVDGAAAGMTIGSPLRAADPDNGQVLTYTIAQNSYFDVHAITGQLSVRSNLPGTGGPVRWYAVNVTVRDSGVPQLSAAVTVNITLQTPTVVNRAPSISASTLSILETTAQSALVSNVSLSASDPDGNALIYTLAGAPDLPFSLDERTGLLTLTRNLDFETTRNYTFMVSVTDIPAVYSNFTLSPQSASASWTVNVLDVNERCSFVGATFTLQENAVMGTSVGTALRASDPDNNAAETTTYTITSGNSGNIFSLTAIADGSASRLSSARLTVARAAVNYETQSLYNLDITATDKGGLTCTARVDVTVLNVNDVPVMAAPPTLSIAENSAVGTLVGGPLIGTDEDGDILTWDIVSGNTGTTFSIAVGSGQLSLAAVPNFEVRTSYNLTVRVSDGRGGVATRVVTVNIQDVAEAPTWTGPLSASIAENSALNTIVFTATAADQDAGEVLSYSISSGNVRDVFAINSATGAVRVSNVAELDYETRASVVLEITVLDRTSLSVRQSVTVNILNVNEAPTIVTSSVTIPENSVAGTRVLQALEVADPDAGDAHTITIVGGNARAGMSSPLFAISDRFIVAQGAVLNFENTSARVYDLTLQVTDAGVPALSTLKVVRVSVTDVNEPPSLAGATRTVSENSAVDAVVGAPLVASDPDAGQTLVFSIVSGDPLGYFKIDGCSGQLKVARVGLDFEANMTFVLTVRVIDDGGDVPGPARLSTTAPVTISVTDVNEACSMADTTRTIPENSPLNTPLGGAVTGSDIDVYAADATWRQLRYSLLSNPRGLFAVQATTGQLAVARNALNFEDPEGNVVEVLLIATDGPGLTCMARVRVTITDVNEAPTLQGADIVRSIDENTPRSPRVAGDLVGVRVSA